MKIPKAIKELTDLSKVGLNRLTPDELTALNLSIEALERIALQHLVPLSMTDRPLPSETKS